jgi:hypothetical protein
MRNWLTGLLGVCLLSPVAAAAPPPTGGWLLDYKEARALARRTGKPLLVVFR